MARFPFVGLFMAIQWYPGHMTSARKKAAEAMASIDVVIELVPNRWDGPFPRSLLACPNLGAQAAEHGVDRSSN
jgi:hypothetical protein